MVRSKQFVRPQAMSTYIGNYANPQTYRVPYLDSAGNVQYQTTTQTADLESTFGSYTNDAYPARSNTFWLDRILKRMYLIQVWYALVKPPASPGVPITLATGSGVIPFSP